VAEVRGDGGEERVVVAGRIALGLVVDAPRRRVLVAYADRPPRFGYAGRLRARLVAPPLPHTTRRARYVRTLGGLLAAPEIYLSLSFFSGGTG
jgi:hypothetical protein